MPERVTKEERMVSLAIEKARKAKEILSLSLENNRLPAEDDSEHIKIKRPSAEKDKTKIENNTGTHSGYGVGGQTTDNTIKKSNVLKMELPPKLKEGEMNTQERNKKINDWSNAYVRDVERQLAERARTHPNFGYFRFKQRGRVAMDGGYNQDFSYGQLANHIKNFMKDLEYGTTGTSYNYKNELLSMAKIPNNVVAELQSNSSYIREFDDYMDSQGY